MSKKWVFLSVYWHTIAQMSQMIHLGFSVVHLFEKAYVKFFTPLDTK